MPRKLDPIIADTLKVYGFGPDACWDCHGVWVVYHRILERIAAQASIKFDPPMIVEANGGNKIAAVCVTGRLKDNTEWSIGEAAPANNKNAYPWAMAEKRGKDRVILKLIGLHGLAYSEDEADDFKPKGQPPAPEQSNGNGGVLTNDQLATLKEMIDEVKADVPKFCKYLEVDSLAQIPQSKLQTALDALAKKRAAE